MAVKTLLISTTWTKLSKERLSWRVTSSKETLAPICLSLSLPRCLHWKYRCAFLRNKWHILSVAQGTPCLPWALILFLSLGARLFQSGCSTMLIHLAKWHIAQVKENDSSM
ncbi:hypothetical protein DUNSADRAFT_3119 [Dunaliella salina]|uniref:Encoded protein n=1 Tax=Dunaliella salina TaxID=3046 RepID=A0ABQ7H809_DUNSA|nr:hypothetical protein DUNSADRAFT_3119 [Dunaliella salina]|eukprot:KAF5842990.1 hypothetical protein DUNSADRAFT_3119 [Dunaliella salina]